MHLSNKFLSKNSAEKYFNPSRLVFDGETPKQPDQQAEQKAASLAESAKTELLQKLLKGDAPDLKSTYVQIIDKATDVDQDVKEKAKNKFAQIEKTLTETMALITRQTQTIARIETLSLAADATPEAIVNYFTKLGPLENDVKSLPDQIAGQPSKKAELQTKIDQQKENAKDKAQTYYSTRISEAGKLAEEISSSDYDPSKDTKHLEGLNYVTALQSFLLKNFGPVENPADLKTTAMETMDKLLRAINTHKSSLEGEYSSVFNNLSKASTNYIDSQKAKNDVEGRKTGAEQFMTVTAAEAQAILAKEGIPEDQNWYVNDPNVLNTPNWQNDTYRAIAAVYSQAFADLQAGREILRQPNAAGAEYLKATALFEKARAGFNTVKIEALKQTSATPEDKEAPKDKNYEQLAEEQRELAVAATKRVSETGNKKLIKYVEDKVRMLRADADVDLKDNPNDASAKYDQIVKISQESLDAYNKLQNNFATAMDRAADQINSNKHDISNWAKIFADFLSDTRNMGGNPELYKTISLAKTYAFHNGQTHTWSATFDGNNSRATITQSALPAKSSEKPFQLEKPATEPATNTQPIAYNSQRNGGYGGYGNQNIDNR